MTTQELIYDDNFNIIEAKEFLDGELISHTKYSKFGITYHEFIETKQIYQFDAGSEEDEEEPVAGFVSQQVKCWYSNEFDDNGNCIKYRDSSSNNWTAMYNANNQITSYTSKYLTYKKFYDQFDRLIKYTESHGYWYKIIYHGRVLYEKRDINGLAHLYHFDYNQYHQIDSEGRPIIKTQFGKPCSNLHFYEENSTGRFKLAPHQADMSHGLIIPMDQPQFGIGLNLLD